MDSNFTKEYLTLLKAISEVAIIAYTDSKGRITFANENFCKISGYSFSELHNQDHHILNSNHHTKEFFAMMYKTVLDRKIWRGEIRNKNKNGSFYWVDTQIIPIFNKENELKSFISIRFDITERKKMEESLINLEKFASLGEMAAIVAHEINNPMTIINLTTDSLLKELKREQINPKSIEQKLDKIITSSSRISKLVRGLKTFSRKSHEDEFALINLKNFIEEVLTFSKCKTNIGIELRINEIPEIEFECRPDQISQVLINLLNNAYDAILGLDEKWIELSANLDSLANYIIFSVRDSGKGIPEKISEKILTPFFTTKEIGKGTGLGLSISKQIVEAHTGELYLDKNDPHTCFVFKIPLKQNKQMKVA